MAAITVRKISDEMHGALKARAKKNARSTEAEARAILAVGRVAQGRSWHGSVSDRPEVP